MLYIYIIENTVYMGLPTWLSGKVSACQCRRDSRRGFNPWVRKMPWRNKWQPTPVFLPGKSHGQRSLVGYSPWGWKRVRHDWASEYIYYVYTLSSLSIYSSVYIYIQLTDFWTVTWSIYLWIFQNKVLWLKKLLWIIFSCDSCRLCQAGDCEQMPGLSLTQQSWDNFYSKAQSTYLYTGFVSPMLYANFLFKSNFPLLLLPGTLAEHKPLP